MNPLNLTAGPFLTLYSAVAAGVLLLLLLWRRQLGAGEAGWGGGGAGLDALHLAYLAGGDNRALDTVLVSFFEAGAARLEQGRARLIIDQPAALPAEWRTLQDVSQASRRQMHRAMRPGIEQLRANLVGRGLLASDAAIDRFQMATLLSLAAVVLLGVAKMAVGAQRGHPVGFLTILVLITVVFGILLVRAPFRTPAGVAVLARIRAENARAARAPTENELLLAFALTGGAVLAGRDYQRFFQSSGDGGGGGDSGGGDGGGGGGCGGCGS